MFNNPVENKKRTHMPETLPVYGTEMQKQRNAVCQGLMLCLEIFYSLHCYRDEHQRH